MACEEKSATGAGRYGAAAGVGAVWPAEAAGSRLSTDFPVLPSIKDGLNWQPPPQQGCFMGFLHSSIKKACPRCGRNWVRRSHRKGAIEKIVCALFSVDPFRCEDCDHRYFRFRSTHSTHAQRHA